LPTERVASVTIATLVIGSEESAAWLRHAVHAVAAILPNAKHRTLEGQFPAAAREVLAPWLEEFFAGRRGARPREW
jgi:hypothetical protein